MSGYGCNDYNEYQRKLRRKTAVLNVLSGAVVAALMLLVMYLIRVQG